MRGGDDPRFFPPPQGSGLGTFPLPPNPPKSFMDHLEGLESVQGKGTELGKGWKIPEGAGKGLENS